MLLCVGISLKLLKGCETLALLSFRKNQPSLEMGTVSPARVGDKELFKLSGIPESCERELYSKLREQVPIIDACIGKIIRLAGGFKPIAHDERFQSILDDFSKNVRIGSSGQSLQTLADICLDSMLTYGCALGEIVYDADARGVCGVYMAPVKNIDIKEGKKPFEREYFVGRGTDSIKIKHTENLIFSALNPSPDNPCGISVLKGLPGLSAILLRIYESIGQNFDRVGNVRYAVTYKPSSDGADKAFARERAMQIAKEWSAGMSAAKNGEIRDFVAVGDVGIKVIGADNQIIDTDIPVKQILEQLVAKLGIPPFLLGLNWSTTERMSSQQTDILTSELEYYRRLLTPIIEKICVAHLRLCGCAEGVDIEWDSINLQDEEALASARLNNAKARSIELENARLENIA